MSNKNFFEDFKNEFYLNQGLLNDIQGVIKMLETVNSTSHANRNSDDTFTRGQASGIEIVSKNTIELLTEIYNRGVYNENK